MRRKDKTPDKLWWLQNLCLLFVGASWLSPESEPILKLGSYLCLTKRLHFSDHLLTPDFWHRLLRQQSETVTAPQCPPVWPQKIDVRVPSWFLPVTLRKPCWWHLGHCTALSSPLSLCLHQRGGTGSTQCLLLLAFHQHPLLPVAERVPRAASWRAKVCFLSLMHECTVNLTCFYRIPLIIIPLSLTLCKSRCCRCWPHAVWDATSGLHKLVRRHIAKLLVALWATDTTGVGELSWRVVCTKHLHKWLLGTRRILLKNYNPVCDLQIGLELLWIFVLFHG